MSGVIGYLASGTKHQIVLFHMSVCFALNGIDRRGDTVHYTCMEEHRKLAEKAAELAGITLEEIVNVGEEEDYKMVVQGDHPGWKNRDRAIYGDQKHGTGREEESES